jgi:hypothetical protein
VKPTKSQTKRKKTIATVSEELNLPGVNVDEGDTSSSAFTEEDDTTVSF